MNALLAPLLADVRLFDRGAITPGQGRAPVKSIRVDIAGGAQRIWVAADAEGVSITNGPFWQQRLTRDEALRLAEAIGSDLSVCS
jgi:hypothetical protein